jgi:adenosylcobinamide amidohydrolase
MVVEAVVVPEVPVMVTVEVPTVAVALAVQVSTLVVVVGFVPNVQVTPEPGLGTVRVTLPVNPPVSVTVMVSVAVLP